MLRPLNLTWDEESLELSNAAEGGFGRFDSDPLTEWLPDGRHMRLKRPFGYFRQNGEPWPVPAEAVVDGASIPRPLWPAIGGPFEGRYHNASIVHDYFCDEQTRPWRDTHQVFYEAMRCGGVDRLQAKIMYYAVYRFGPRWSLPTDVELPAVGLHARPLATEGFDAEAFEADARLIRETDPELDTIEALADIQASDREFIQGGGDLRRLLVEAQDLDDAAVAKTASRRLILSGSLGREPRAFLDEEGPPPSYERLKAGYEQLYSTCRIRPGKAGEVVWHRDRILKHRERYAAVEQRTGAPWWFVGVVHALEASFNFGAHLHNGDPLSGRTVQVPKGRPLVWNPPSDWLSSAVDAIEHEGYAGQQDWSPPRALHRWERYNGFGYHSKGINSPYLWSYSTHYKKGKFIRDGVYDPNAVSKQCGAAVMLKALQESGAVSFP